jgi:hypothetical protein
MTRSARFKVLVPVLLISTLQTPAFANDAANDPVFDPAGTKSCLINRVKDKVSSLLKGTPVTEAELERLEAVKVSDIFTLTEKVSLESGNTIERAKVTSEQTTEFNKVWDDLRYQRKWQVALPTTALKRAIKETGGEKGHPKFSAEEIEIFRQANLTVRDVQDLLIKRYMTSKYLTKGDFDGLKKYLSHESPDFVAKLAWNGTKGTFTKIGAAVPVGLISALAAILYRPVVDQSNKEFKHVTSKALEQLPENKAYADSIEDNQKLEKETLAFDYSQLKTKEDRIKKWQEIESLFQKSHETIRLKKAEVKVLAAETEQNKKVTTPYLRANRITYLTSLSDLAKDKSKDSKPVKALALANFKAQDVKTPPTQAESAMTQAITDKILSQVAEDPESFQQFITEFVSMQTESVPQTQ